MRVVPVPMVCIKMKQVNSVVKVVWQDFIIQRRVNQKFLLVYHVLQERIRPLLEHHLNPRVKIVQQGRTEMKLVPLLPLVVKVVWQDCTIHILAKQMFQRVHHVWQELILPILEQRWPSHVKSVTVELFPTPQQQVLSHFAQLASQEHIIVNKAVIRRHIV